MSSFDAIVIGGGHAGAEATRLLARGGKRVAMITLVRSAVGRMSCNPAIGGLAKGHLVKELDAMGGLMPEAADAAGIQFKVLNRSKGPAVQGPRAQCDKELYATTVQRLLEREPNAEVLEGCVTSLESKEGRISGVRLSDGRYLEARTVIVTTGTFLRALMHSGEEKTIGGRFGEPSAENLSDALTAIGLTLGRLKTGTPPRILRDSVDYASMEPQPGDDEPRPFSILTDAITRPQLLCWMTYTSAASHDLIRANLHRAPMYSGQIQATGPRYCPSIEDKVVRFAAKERHQIFVEPEGIDHPWLYLNGISTSLPADVQDGVIHSITGLENAVIARYGYAVEYDFVNPEQLDSTLQTRCLSGLFLAGQINGTSGYEEAAAQGFVAGLNALQFLRNEAPVIFRRDQSYTGVMVDDLVTLGTEEPYRMFTSRAEHRLLLGCDSVYERLSPMAERLGVLDDERRSRIDGRASRIARARNAVSIELTPDRETSTSLSVLGLTLTDRAPLSKLMQKQEFDLTRFLAHCHESDWLPDVASALAALSSEEQGAVLNEARYAGYLERERREAERSTADEEVRIPVDFDYHRPGLSREVVEKLSFVRPASLGQAARVRGITPAAVSVLRMHLRQQVRKETHDRGREDRALSGAAPAVVGSRQPDRS